ncbi:transposase [Zunongwangia sp. F363]|uniref:Transposase n=1 Tax=Autumnicola tepida TaxID=3075595 RepID=A0ABU3C4L6_9FLAO|nr:transposase [Zunongwangia sp. F363]MDT0641287.1 transposase [Zunongwangia sp. F363]
MKYEPLIPEQYYHIYNCGNNKQDIFFEKRNYIYFLELMRQYLATAADIYSYCLLKNHFHLLVRTKEKTDSKKISRSFSNLFNAYAKAINKGYKRTGSLFQDRFQRKKIEDEKYLKSLILYIHLNPEHHNFTDDFSSYEHSSFRSLISEKPTLLQRKEIFELFHDRKNFIGVHYSRRTEVLEDTAELFLE